MGLSKYKLGELITQRREKYDGKETLQSWGVSREGFIRPKQEDADTSIYNVFYRNDFVFNPARMELNSIALNSFYNKAICSSLYEVFYVTREDIVLPEYLNMFIKRDEFARRCWYEAIGSARNYFRVGDLSQFEITLPSIEQQRKYVDVYLALQNNLAAYQSKVDELKLVCDGYIEDLRRKIGAEPIGPYLRSVDVRNENLTVTLTQGVDVNMQFIPAKREAEDQEGTKIVRTGQFAFNKVIKSNGTKLPIALRDGPDCVISSSYEVFEVVDKEKLISEYLMLWLSRSETHRQCGYKSYGTTRDVFPFEDLCKLQFPIPNIETQKNIANIYKCYIERQRIAAQLKEQLNQLCPILIKGSLGNNN
ncbi:MAG: restriction endonuclease subunit S [Prevotella sp.]|nr:restriction endonuclease subunit S [Prevotella sp.]